MENGVLNVGLPLSHDPNYPPTHLLIYLFCVKQQFAPLHMATATETDKMAALATAANEARGLAMDSIAAAHSGHMGLPLGAAEIGAILYGSQVRFVEIIILIFVLPMEISYSGIF
jgi:Transketolase, thiamine diphosphate binding domain